MDWNSTHIPPSKGVLRRRLKTWRSARDRGEAEQDSRAACTRILALPEWKNARTVMLYMPVRGELSLNFLFGATGDRRVVLPVVRGPDMPLLARIARDMQPGRFGIPEPGPLAPRVDLGDVDLVIVPGVGFDRRGGRLGYGGGFYDRTLAEMRACRVGVAFSPQVLEQLPSEPHDHRMDILVTESEVLRFMDR